MARKSPLLRLAWRIDGQWEPLARRFKPGSWPHRTILRAGDYWWLWLCFKPTWRKLRG